MSAQGILKSSIEPWKRLSMADRGRSALEEEGIRWMSDRSLTSTGFIEASEVRYGSGLHRVRQEKQ